MFPGIHIPRHLAYIIAMKHGRHICAGQEKHVVGLDLTLARIGSHDSGLGKAADIPGGQKVGQHTHAPEAITTKHRSCGETLR